MTLALEILALLTAAALTGNLAARVVDAFGGR
jgi:hypothetical protein